MTITLNGEPREIQTGTTITALLEQMSLAPDQVAVEVNRRLVRSAQYATELHPDDQIEIVTFVGGG